MEVDERLRGSGLGIASALLFGLAAPLSKLLLPSARPLMLAALLYLGAGASFLLARRRPGEAPLTRADAPALAGAVIAGAALGPVLMLWGLSRVSGLAGSLLLNLEAPFTIALAVLVFREHLSAREGLCAAVIVLGAALLGGRGEWSGSIAGAGAIALACACWALDNNLAAILSLKDPVQVLRIKALCAGAANLLFAIALGQALPPLSACAAALAVGAVSYGASLLLYLRAQRVLGAARQSALFAAAPFAGAAASIVLLGDRPAAADYAGAALMALGVAALLRAKHAHIHTHEPMEHDHLHVHDLHHQHLHEGPLTEPHAHPHRHDALTHAHAHVSDAHHRHRHR
ncbi:MAG TPA: DMT family transporter [Myxococcales bacterium]|jgi:drug/metabolite transporter (DMT)-like permease|nr:DMT family transporter [Myxococcales bacterium]